MSGLRSGSSSWTRRGSATFHTGVLEVHVPKVEEAKARKVEITA